jgi:uncharacterized repeat protein (TIGR04076 family)
MNNYRVTISVEKLEGMCPLYAVGQTVATLNGWYFESRQEMKLCSHAVAAMLTALGPFSKGVSARDLGFGKDDDLAYVQCPDPGKPYTCGGTVTFRLEREEIANPARCLLIHP